MRRSRAMGRMAGVVLLGLAAAAGLAGAAPAPAASPLTVEAISVTPADPTPTTLCNLRVKIQNHGARAASRFAFDVRVNDVPIAVYKHLLYFEAIPAGATVELRLYNFWATETSRPLPADGKLRVSVRLLGARWVEESKDAKGGAISAPQGEIAGLPVERETVVEMKRPGA